MRPTCYVAVLLLNFQAESSDLLLSLLQLCCRPIRTQLTGISEGVESTTYCRIPDNHLWPVQQGVVSTFQCLVFLGVFLQSGVVLQQLLHVSFGSLHLHNLAAQLALQILTSALGLLQEAGQLTSLQIGEQHHHVTASEPFLRSYVWSVAAAVGQSYLGLSLSSLEAILSNETVGLRKSQSLGLQ